MIGPIFDGHDLGELAVCGDPSRTVAVFRPDLVQVPGRDYSVHAGQSLGDGRVEFTAALTGRDETERRVRLSRLAAILDVDGPRRLLLPDMPDVWYEAVPDCELSFERLHGGDLVQVGFVLLSAGHGARRALTVPSGGTVEFRVGGEYATRPTVTASAAVRESSSGAWEVRLDGGPFLRVALGSGAHAVALDCAARTCTVDGDVALPSLDSDWLVLGPGPHELQMRLGTGVAEVSYEERWH